MTTELFPSNGCSTDACFRSCYLAHYPHTYACASLQVVSSLLLFKCPTGFYKLRQSLVKIAVNYFDTICKQIFSSPPPPVWENPWRLECGHACCIPRVFHQS
jgi:hypothetical protein